MSNSSQSEILQQFVSAVFPPDLLGDDEHVLIAFAGGKGFIKRPATSRTLRSRRFETEPSYFHIATVRAPQAEALAGRPGLSTTKKWKGGKADLKRVYAIVLDDIGTKIDAGLIKAEPDWRMETSPGNFQYGYLIEPNTPERVEAAMIAIGAAGLTDPGALGAYRIVRLPRSIHSVVDAPKFTVWKAAVTWRDIPDRDYGPRWPLEQLLDALGLDGAAVLAPENVAAPAAPQRDTGPIELHGVVDIMADWLVEHGHVRQNMTAAQSGGVLVVDCPWDDEHTGPAQGTDTVYKPMGVTSEGMGAGDHRSAHCSHGHCTGRVTMDFLAAWQKLGAPSSPELEGADTLERGQARQRLMEKLNPTAAAAGATETTESGDGEPDVELIEPAAGAPLPGLAAALAIKPTPLVPAELLPDLAVVQSGAAKETQFSTVANVEAVLAWLNQRPRFNLMTREPAFAEGFSVERFLAVCQRRGIKNAERIMGALTELAQDRPFHPMDEAITAAGGWDEVDRFPALAATVRLEDESLRPLFEACLRPWFRQGAHACAPGAEPRALEFVLLFTGPGGCGKTSWFRELMPSPEFFNEGVSLNLTGNSTKHSIMAAISTVLAELGELETTFRQTEAGAKKAFLSNRVDILVLPYGRLAVRIQRRTFFCATCNWRQVLRDLTGNRRYWAFAVLSCDWEKLAHDREFVSQLWAQVMHEWEAGLPLTLSEADAAAMELQAQSHVEEPAPWGKLDDWYEDACGTFKDVRTWRWHNAAQIIAEALIPNALDNKVARQLKDWRESRLGACRERADWRRRVWLMPGMGGSECNKSTLKTPTVLAHLEQRKDWPRVLANCPDGGPW